MPDDREQQSSERVERVARDLMAGKRLKIGPADASDRGAIMAAAALAGAREPFPRMPPAFRRRLQSALERGREPGVMSRRTALVAGLAAAVGAVTGAAMARLMPEPAAHPVGRGGGIQNRIPAVRWYDAGPLSAFKEGLPVRFQAGAVGTYLIRRGESVKALSSVCTHLPCELAWGAETSSFNCPCHNVAFDGDGFQITTPEGYPLPPLPQLDVRVTASGRVEVAGP